MESSPDTNTIIDSEEIKLFFKAFEKAVDDADFEIILEWWEDGFEDSGLIVM